uniref:Uncharacterized protein n=1 Tax=Anguilla anguilla TaxID=7936 RepID=A0A0E9S1Z8_ANGAN
MEDIYFFLCFFQFLSLSLFFCYVNSLCLPPFIVWATIVFN